MTTGTQQPERWSFGRLYAALYVFTAAAVAINLFLLGLMGQSLGLPALTPAAALILGLPLGLPANWLVTRWVQGLIDEAEDRT